VLIVILKSQDGLRLRLVALFVSDVQVCLPYFCFYFIFIGVHRQLGVHITKIKSVNLDKWPEGKVPLFEHVSNHMVNSYWEKNLPASFRKPG